MYRVGWPLWKLVAKAKIPLHFRLVLHFDNESRTFWMNSPDIAGLVVGGQDIEEVQREALLAAETLLELEIHQAGRLHIRPHINVPLAQA